MGNIIIYQDKIKMHKMLCVWKDSAKTWKHFRCCLNLLIHTLKKKCKCFCSDNILKCGIELTHPWHSLLTQPCIKSKVKTTLSKIVHF